MEKPTGQLITAPCTAPAAGVRVCVSRHYLHESPSVAHDWRHRWNACSLLCRCAKQAIHDVAINEAKSDPTEEGGGKEHCSKCRKPKAKPSLLRRPTVVVRNLETHVAKPVAGGGPVDLQVGLQADCLADFWKHAGMPGRIYVELI